MIVHLNGQLVPHDQARVSVFDRGFQFGDGVYEGLRAFGGWVRNLDDHIARMQAGLDEARIPCDASALRELCPALLRANELDDAFLYWQVTRGTPQPGANLRARLPEPGMAPTVFGYCRPVPGVESLTEPSTCSAQTVPDLRWDRGHVKSISLLGNVIAAIEAAGSADAGPTDHRPEAILVRDGYLAESCATNTFVVLRADTGARLVTPPVGPVSILDGITRKIMLGLWPDAQVRMIHERELHLATEVFLVGTMTTVRSVVELNGRKIGTGTPGPVASEMLRRYADYVRTRARERAAGAGGAA